MKLLLIDHEDSFVYNLAQAFELLGVRVSCIRYTTPYGEARRTDPDLIVFSPGPGHPADRRITGLARQFMDEHAGRTPMLGVCLGHQLLGDYYGASVIRAPEPVHGEVAEVLHDGGRLFHDVPSPFPAARYHSLVIDGPSLPSELRLTACGRDGLAMAVQHRDDPTFGVQFHPESYLTRVGPRILENFVNEGRR
ncbi:MAG: aminodeoxychorismate/anthranilate synthase component II [Thermoplasmata archaeon]